MKTTEPPEKKSTDVWLLLVIATLICVFGGGLWLTGKTIIARLDEIETRVDGRQDQLKDELSALRKQTEALDALTHKTVEQMGGSMGATLVARHGDDRVASLPGQYGAVH